MKIITILLLMVSTQILAEERLSVPDGDGDITERLTYTVEQCNQIANVSKRTIKAAISGVPIAEVTEFFAELPSGSEQLNRIGADDPKGPGSYNLLSGGDEDDFHLSSKAVLGTQHTSTITAIYKTVDQIKTKYGQVREQDRVRLNNRAEQKLIECRKTAIVVDDKAANY